MRRTRLRVSFQLSSTTVSPWHLSAKVSEAIGSGSSPGSIRTGCRRALRKRSMARYASRAPARGGLPWAGCNGSIIDANTRKWTQIRNDFFKFYGRFLLFHERVPQSAALNPHQVDAGIGHPGSKSLGGLRVGDAGRLHVAEIKETELPSTRADLYTETIGAT